MIDHTAASRIAAEYVRRLGEESGLNLTLHKEATQEREFGWVFFYGSERDEELLAGNAPFIVDRRDGSIHVTGTARPLQEYLNAYVKSRGASPR